MSSGWLVDQMDRTWAPILIEAFRSDYMRRLEGFLIKVRESKKVVYPSADNIFTAFHLTSFNDVKVVVLGQDPYHGPGQAHGLSFSVPEGVKVPPSLMNIYKELNVDIGMDIPEHGCLDSWAEQGVLLLNSVLTVEAHQAASHKGKGWEEFTDKVMQAINAQKEHVVFLLWGSYAHKKGQFLDEKKHLVLRSAHPSPLSAYRGFLGCKHFSQTNTYLKAKGYSQIDWTPKAVEFSLV